MGITKYTDKPIGRLRRATGMDDSILKLGKRTKKDLLQPPPYTILGWFQRQAVENPGMTQFRYHEENDYEYEDRCTYDEATNTLITNSGICPIAYNHHVGSTCPMCGLKD